jgi:pimeloyl-ACP methyl ester carboxylesterase
MSDVVESFAVQVSDEVLVDLRERLARTRWPDQIPGTTWEYGCDMATLRTVCDYWLNEFDWSAAQGRLNRWPHVITTVDGIRVHAIHARSPHANALPLCITHGWPGSVAEFLDIIDPLIDPPAYGGDAADAFHVVAPSIPGYGFSGPTTRTGVDIRTVAGVNVGLMARLGYDRYGAQGGDWGAIATAHMGQLDPHHVAGIHVNMAIPRAPKENPMDGVTAEEMAALGELARFRDEGTGYQRIQGTKPQTLAYGLNDSPAGLAGWILEKFQAGSDCHGDVLGHFTLDQLCTNLTIYWVTGTINSSTRLYFESMKSGGLAAIEGRIEVPAAIAVFPAEMIRPPRVWCEQVYDIRQWTVMPSGGHFAAMEEPQLLIDDVRMFFRSVR